MNHYGQSMMPSPPYLQYGFPPPLYGSPQPYYGPPAPPPQYPTTTSSVVPRGKKRNNFKPNWNKNKFTTQKNTKVHCQNCTCKVKQLEERLQQLENLQKKLQAELEVARNNK